MTEDAGESFGEVWTQVAQPFDIESEERQTYHDEEKTLQERQKQAYDTEYNEQDTGNDTHDSER